MQSATSRRGRSLIVVSLMVMGALLSTTPASANPTDVGTGVINCTANLSAGFPTGPTSASGSCDGTFTGEVDGMPLVLVYFHAEFDYNEPCPPAIGTASGYFEIHATASPTSSVKTKEFFTWTRVGATAAILIGDSANPGPLSSDGAGAASFAAVVGPGNVTGCPGPGITAEVVATGAWA